MTRGELLARISSRELTEWMAYYALEPFGEVQDEYRAALVASMVANTARDEKKHSEAFQAKEFMRACYTDGLEEKVEVDLFEKAKAIFGVLGAKK